MHDNIHTYGDTRRAVLRSERRDAMTPVVMDLLEPSFTFKDDLKAAFVISGIVAVIVALACVAMGGSI